MERRCWNPTLTLVLLSDRSGKLSSVSFPSCQTTLRVRVDSGDPPVSRLACPVPGRKAVESRARDSP